MIRHIGTLLFVVLTVIFVLTSTATNRSTKNSTTPSVIVLVQINRQRWRFKKYQQYHYHYRNRNRWRRQHRKRFHFPDYNYHTTEPSTTPTTQPTPTSIPTPNVLITTTPSPHFSSLCHTATSTSSPSSTPTPTPLRVKPHHKTNPKRSGGRLKRHPRDRRCAKSMVCSGLRKRDCRRCFTSMIRRKACIQYTSGIYNTATVPSLRNPIERYPWLRRKLQTARARRKRPDTEDVYCVGFYQLYVTPKSGGQLDVGDKANFIATGAGTFVQEFLHTEQKVMVNVTTSVSYEEIYVNAAADTSQISARRLTGPRRLPIAATHKIQFRKRVRAVVVRRSVRRVVGVKGWNDAFERKAYAIRRIIGHEGRRFVVVARFNARFRQEFF